MNKTVQMVGLDLIDFLRDAEGEILNPRGEHLNTTDLQETMPLIGQTDSVELLLLPTGRYVVKDGHRRITGARALGWKEIRAEVEVVETVQEDEVLAHMIASDTHQTLKPTHLARAMAKLMLSKRWGIERVAKLRGMKTDVAQLHLDLLQAPESLQRRVDAGEISLSAWKALRDKPKPVQQKAAELEKPTVENVRKLAREEAGRKTQGGVMLDLLNQPTAEHTVVNDVNKLRLAVIAAWGVLTEIERASVESVISDLHRFMSQQEEYADVS